MKAKKDLIGYGIMTLTFVVVLGVLVILGGTITGEVISKDEESFVNVSEEDLSPNLGINNFKVEKDGFNMTYSFDNKGFIGDSISVDMWIIDSNNSEVKRIREELFINKDGLVEENVFIEIPKDVEGVYSVHLALSSELDNYIKIDVFSRKPSITGFTIMENPGLKMAGYVVFLLVIGAFVFLIYRARAKEMTEGKKKG